MAEAITALCCAGLVERHSLSACWGKIGERGAWLKGYPAAPPLTSRTFSHNTTEASTSVIPFPAMTGKLPITTP